MELWEHTIPSLKQRNPVTKEQGIQQSIYTSNKMYAYLREET